MNMMEMEYRVLVAKGMFPIINAGAISTSVKKGLDMMVCVVGNCPKVAMCLVKFK